MTIQFKPLDSRTIADIRANRIDAHGQPVEVHISDGSIFPCRSCLAEIPAGRDYLILAHRPFDTVNAFTETGPIFLCADDCAAHEPSADLPPALISPRYLVRGYSADERIVYGTGDVVATADIPAFAEALLARPDVAFADVRSARNNCYQCRIVSD